jgi:hypothetical protein
VEEMPLHAVQVPLNRSLGSAYAQTMPACVCPSAGHYGAFVSTQKPQRDDDAMRLEVSERGRNKSS